ncbi:hypothetical protein ACLOJK_036971 [Asimina triloba]
MLSVMDHRLSYDPKSSLLMIGHGCLPCCPNGFGGEMMGFEAARLVVCPPVACGGRCRRCEGGLGEARRWRRGCPSLPRSSTIIAAADDEGDNRRWDVGCPLARRRRWRSRRRSLDLAEDGFFARRFAVVAHVPPGSAHGRLLPWFAVRPRRNSPPGRGSRRQPWLPA